jgi:hypothetical protein
MWSNGDPTDYFTIRGNYISSVALHGINVNDGNYYIIENNYIEKCWMGWDASTGSSNAEIFGNEVYYCLFGAKTHQGQNLFIHDNNHHNLDDKPYYYNGWAYNSGTGFVLQGPGVNAVVKNNRFSGVTADKGIAWWDQGSDGIVLENNDTAPSSPGGAEPEAPNITTQPQSATIEEGGAATFSVGAGGTLPLSYQWYVNDVKISGATESSYVTGVLSLSDDGKEYYCVVSNSEGSAASEKAVLHVIPGDGTINLSLNKPVAYSSQQDETYAASNVVDGIEDDGNDRWSASPMPQWV